MPSGKTEANGETSAANPAQRTTFRPPWVKEGPNPLPVPAQPWELKKANKKDSNASADNPSDSPLGVTLKKVSVQTKEPQENGALKDVTFEKPKLKPVPAKEISIPKKNKIPLPKLNSITDATSENPLAGVQLRKTSIKTSEPPENGAKEPEFIKPKLKPVPVRETSPPKKDHKLQLPKLNSVAERKLKDPPRKPSLTRMPTKDDDLDKEVPATRNALVREESMRRLSQSHSGPAPPPMPPPAPLMPGEVDKKPLSSEQKKKLEMLKARPKTRPDWSSMLKEIEGNKKLRHVQCNDRSQPLLTEAKATDHFVFESEKDNCHNELLKEIQFGIRLKSVKTNDRSKPMLEGLRKFRRQMTIEEQIQKSISMASIPPEEIPVEEQDEMDDIDKVRDDLQSTKQMLALELRNKEAQIRENKMLQARIQNLEAELEREKNKKAEGGGTGGGGGSPGDEKIIKSLKTEADQAKKHSEELEKKYKESAEQLDNTKSQLEEIRRQNREMERKLQEALSGKRMSISDHRKNSMANGGDNSDLDFFSSDDEEESDGEENEEKREKKVQKELKHLRNKLRNFKNKEDNAKKERIALREIIKRNQTAIKAEKKKFKQLQKEVDKMAALMKDTGDDEDEDEDEEKPEEEEDTTEEESSEEETESESDDSDSEKSQSESEDAPVEKKKNNLEARNNRHESILAALKKGNFMLKTSAERLQDELNKQKDATESLKLDLDSVLSELG